MSTPTPNYQHEKQYVSLKKPVAIISGIVALIVVLAAVAGAYSIGRNQSIEANVAAQTAAKQADYRKISGELKNKQDDLDAADRTIAEADTAKAGIDDLRKQHDDLDAQVNDAQSKLSSLNSQIDAARGKPIQLPAGNFTVGKEVPAGRYVISGSSNFIVDEGRSINTVLGDSSVGTGDYHGDLSDGDTIENHAPATLTPVQ